MRLALLLTAASLVLGPAPARAAETVAVVVSGSPMDPVPSYKAGGELYLDAKRVAEVYGGQVYSYPVSGRVQLTLRGRTVQFLVDTKKATAGEAAFELSSPVIVRASRAFLPLSFLSSDAFAKWSGYDARFDAGTKTLQVEKRTTAGPARAFSYKGRTRLTLDLGPGVTYQAVARGVGAMEVVIPFGVVDGDDKVEVDDGVLSSYQVKQEARSAKVTVRFAENGQRWKAVELSDPRRLVVDVYAPGAVPPAQTPADEPAAKSDKVPAAPAAAAAAAKPAPAPETSKAAPAAAAKPAPAKPAEPRQRVIVIDAGHGGKDPGATGTRGTKEKDITLAASLELARVLRERGDFKVVLTRDDDTFVPLSDRSKTANDIDADLFVSLHCNANRSRRETGFEVYSVSERASDPEAEALAASENAALELEGKKPEEEAAKLILLAMTKTEMLNESAPFAALVERSIAKRAGVSDRGAKQAGFYVLRGTHAPAILVEMAFVSNPKDEAQLGSRRFRRKLAEGVAAGVADYARKKGWLE